LIAGLWCASRTTMVALLDALPYARAEGLATAFAGGGNFLVVPLGTLVATAFVTAAVGGHSLVIVGGAWLAVVGVGALASRRIAGVAHAAVGIGLGAAAGRLVRSRAVATYVAVSGNMLGATARDISRRLDAGDLAGARAALPALVGRDPSELDEGEIARAVVE